MRGYGQKYIRGGQGTGDKLQQSMDATFGIREALAAGAKPFIYRGRPSLSQAYAAISGDSELRYLGYGGMFGRVREAADNVSSGDYPAILLNSMTKRLIQDYAEVPMGGVERLFVTTQANDYKTQHRVRLGYLGDLADVSEGGVYQEFTKPTDDLISFPVTKRGNLLSITEETILNDDLGKITGFTSRMARAARRTLKQFVTNFFVHNPNYDPDATAWFHAAHDNLFANALSPDALTAARAALKQQTEKDSNKPLALPLQWIMFHPDLWSTARAINQTDKWPTGPGTFTANPWYRMFGDNDEGLIENELLTDTNDWYYGCWPSECPCVEVAFLSGYEQPQMFFNRDPSSGSMPFVKDELQYKVKHPYGGDVLDFRGVGMSAVA